LHALTVLRVVASAGVRAALQRPGYDARDGWLSPNFDELLVGDVLPRVKLAARQLASRRATVSRLELEREGIGGPEAQWTRDVELDALREDFCALQRLLEQDGPSET
jgi:hypothetical protein